MARRATRAPTAKRKKAAPKKSTRKKTAPKKKSGGIGRLMLGGAFVAGTLSAIIAVGSMLELDRASDEFGRAADQSAPNYALAEPEPTPKLRKDYKLSENANVSERGRTGYLVGENNETTRSTGQGGQGLTDFVPAPTARKPDQGGEILSGDSGNDVPMATVGPTNQPWQKYAALTQDTGDKPVIAIVIDDAGLDQPRTAKTVDLPGPITISYLPYARDLQAQVNAARKAGHEVMLHMPMEPSSASVDPGPHALLASYDRQKILNEMSWMLDRFDGYVGVNNHMGSKFTADPERMRVVMEVMKSRGLMFLDSRTSADSVGYSTASSFGVPAITRDIFIDDADDAAKIADMLARTENVARKQGFAIAIGHPRDLTIGALKTWIPEIQAKGFVLVPITDVLRRSMQSVTG
ncbi:divergent polysaccharide deacetylase family protein [Thalassospira sp. A40-3]|uniref:divergent polysaccharide deacetylase family protein n=1 Tax=Thalassospira sp. A40-3 TaxID=2785908 RepID=UPI0018CF3522|nr:divergent polysaccharide deacetylase family protein [Thalassospira sp. A40-3]QPO13434.1 divergent polysaccharide deacetylase family protein [Thalassospira sp. A40-3]